MLYADASRRPFGISPFAMHANHPKNAHVVASAPRPLRPANFDRPLREVYPAAKPPPRADASMSAGTARKIRKNVFDRDWDARSGSRRSIGYSPSSPMNPGYGLPTRYTYAFRWSVERTYADVHPCIVLLGVPLRSVTNQFTTTTKTMPIDHRLIQMKCGIARSSRKKTVGR